MAGKRRRPPRMTPPPRRSARIYVRLPRPMLAKLKFLLEGHDNLCYASVLDRWEATAVIVFSPQQREEVLAVLDSLAPELDLERLVLPGVEA